MVITGITSQPTDTLKFYLLFVREQLSLSAHSGITKKHYL